MPGPCSAKVKCTRNKLPILFLFIFFFTMFQISTSLLLCIMKRKFWQCIIHLLALRIVDFFFFILDKTFSVTLLFQIM
jgi:hypothetical protein